MILLRDKQTVTKTDGPLIVGHKILIMSLLSDRSRVTGSGVSGQWSEVSVGYVCRVVKVTQCPAVNIR